MDIETSANSTCRDEESDCSIEEDPESNETDANASVDLNKEDNKHHCHGTYKEGQMNAFVITKGSPTIEGSGRVGETSAATGDTDIDMLIESTSDENRVNATMFAGSESGEDSDEDVTDNEDSGDNATDEDEVNAAMFKSSEAGEGELEASTDKQDIDETDSDDDVTDSEENEMDVEASIISENQERDTGGQMNMFVEQLPGASEEVPSDQEEMNADMFVNSTCRDKKSDCSIESDTKDDKTDAEASIGSSAHNEKVRHLKVPPDKGTSHVTVVQSQKEGTPSC